MKILTPLILLFLHFSHAAEKVIILGDSVTEGYGVNKGDAFPAQLQKLVKDRFKIVAAGISGSTSASGPKRVKWVLKQKPKILIIALGANDGLRGIDPNDTAKNLAKAIGLAQKKQVTVILAGMKAPPNYGKEFTQKFENIFPLLAKKYKVALIPFLLKGVAGEPKLNIDDGIHPNAKGHKIIAALVLPFLNESSEK